MIKLTVLLVLISLFTACGSLNIEKRKYTKGFYLSSLKTDKKDHHKIVANIHPENNKIEKSTLAFSEEKMLIEPLTIESANLEESKICDTIVLRNGAILSVNIIEKTDSTVMYSFCNDVNNQKITVPSENIKLIKYKDGKYSVFKEKEIESKKRTNSAKKIKEKPEKTANSKNTEKPNKYTFLHVLLIILAGIGLTALAGTLLIITYLNLSSTFFIAFLAFLIVSLCFYLFLLICKRKNSLFTRRGLLAFSFGLFCGIMAYFISDYDSGQ